MAIYVKNPEVERKARELAARLGESVTAALDRALSDALAKPSPIPPPRVRTLEDIKAAIQEFRDAIGLYGPVHVSKEEWDELNAIPGFDPDESFLDEEFGWRDQRA